ncbi:MAG: NAD(P)-dependent oxidoreductase [Candidatus Omnitrophica bacterium]|nr:NAD(P)-dependent oxidoreductase [Candidatus Omnitrophota bacterium]
MKTYFNTKTFDAFLKKSPLVITDDVNEASLLVLGAKKIDFSVFPKLKAVYRFGVGQENVDFNYLKSRDVAIHFPAEAVKDIVYEGTANFTVLGIMSLIFDNICGDAESWTKEKRVFLKNRKALVIGMGHIGRKVFEKLSVFMTMQSFDVLKNSMDELELLIREADVITIHIPLNDQTKNFFDEEKLSWVKEDVILANTARGDLYNEGALYKKLTQSKCRAFFDVFWQEPYSGKLKELGYKKFLMTPHSASNTRDFVEKGFSEILEIDRSLKRDG